MANDSEIEQKYKIVFVNNQRYYYEDLSQKDYSLEFTTPLSLEAGKRTFITSSWKQLLIDVCTYLLSENPFKQNALITYKMSWCGKHQFFDSPGKNLYPIGEDIYILCNLTAIHACWVLRDVLTIFGIDLRSTKFIIHRPPGAEPIECRKYYEEKTINAFKYYYTNLLKRTKEKADQVIRNIDKLNYYLPNVSKAYSNFYLIDNYGTFLTYKTKLINYLRDELYANEKMLKLSNFYLNILGEFYKVVK